MAKTYYIPGATSSTTGKRIAWMTGRYGEGSLKAGIHMRTLGMQSIERNFNIAIARLMGHTTGGLMKAAYYLRNEMFTKPPTVPRDTGELRDSWFAVPYGGKLKQNVGMAGPAVLTGFKADYALYVHEMTNDAYMKRINWKEPGSGPKFLQTHFQKSRKEMLAVIQLEAEKTFKVL